MRSKDNNVIGFKCPWCGETENISGHADFGGIYWHCYNCGKSENDDEELAETNKKIKKENILKSVKILEENIDGINEFNQGKDYEYLDERVQDFEFIIKTLKEGK